MKIEGRLCSGLQWQAIEKTEIDGFLNGFRYKEETTQR